MGVASVLQVGGGCYYSRAVADYSRVATIQRQPLIKEIWCIIIIIMLLYIPQDALCKEHATEDSESRLQACTEILKKAHSTLRNFKSDPSISVGYLEAVAGTKFAIMEVATLIHSQLTNEAAGLQLSLIHI